MKKRLILILVLLTFCGLFYLALCAIDSHRKKHYFSYFINISGFFGEYELFLNDQKVIHWSGGIHRHFGNFYVPGKNILRIKAKKRTGTPKTLIVKVTTSNRLFPKEQSKPLVHFEYSGDSPIDNLDESFSFNVEMPSMPRWRECDDIPKLTDTDKTEIYNVLKKIHRKLLKKEFNFEDLAFNSLPSYTEEESVFPQDMFNTISNYKDYSVFIAEKENISFNHYGKIVWLYPIKGQRLYHAGHSLESPPQTKDFSYSISTYDLHFVRDKGKWLILL